MAFSSSATHQKTSAPLLPWNRLRIMPSRIQATGSIEVRGEGSALGQKQGVAMWQRSHLGGDLFNRLLEKLGKSGCPLSPFPSPSTITWGVRFLKSCYESSIIKCQGRTSPGLSKVLKNIPLDAPFPEESLSARLPRVLVLRQVLISNGRWGYEADAIPIDLSIIALVVSLATGRLHGCPTLSLRCL